jgi:hypothetical protein
MEIRNLKQLLQLTLIEGNKSFKKENVWYSDGYYGLCGFVKNGLYMQHLITGPECETLQHFIEKNRPQKDSPHYRKSQDLMAYYWKEGAWRPRKLWIIDQIKNI